MNSSEFNSKYTIPTFRKANKLVGTNISKSAHHTILENVSDHLPFDLDSIINQRLSKSAHPITRLVGTNISKSAHHTISSNEKSKDKAEQPQAVEVDQAVKFAYTQKINKFVPSDDLVLELAQHLLTYNPKIKYKKALEYTTKYISAVVSEIYRGLTYSEDLDFDGQIQYRYKEVQIAVGQIQIGKTRVWMTNYFAMIRGMELVTEIVKGTQGMNSQVKLTQKYKEKLMSEITRYTDIDYVRSSDKDRRSVLETANELIRVNPKALESFIAKSQQTLLTATGGYAKKIYSNQRRALDLQLIMLTDVTGSYLPELHETADTGRIYGKGISLKNQPKEVRHAALGHCWEYDFQANSFAVMTSLAKELDPELRVSALEDFVVYRAKIRDQIAKQTGLDVWQVKQVFTSLGFGARVIDNCHHAIRKLMSQDQYDRLISLDQFQYIIEDLEKINTVIDNAFSDTGFTFFLNQEYLPTYVNDKGITKNRNQAQKLAWIYQNAESFVMSEFVRIVKEQSGLTPLLVVHDGVYYDTPVPNETVKDAQYQIRIEFPLVKIEETKIYPICTDESFNNRFKEEQDREAEHKLFIEQERDIAVRVHSDNVMTSGTHLNKEYSDYLVQAMLNPSETKASNPGEPIYDFSEDPYYDEA